MAHSALTPRINAIEDPTGGPIITPAFFASRNAVITRVSSAGPSQTLIAFDTEAYDSKNNFSTGVFTAPYNGIYRFTVHVVYYNGILTTDTVNLYLYKNTSAGTLLHRQAQTATTTGQNTFSFSIDVQLAAADTASVYDAIERSGGSDHNVDILTDAIQPKRTFFCGGLVTRT